jgi:hypothetical protein
MPKFLRYSLEVVPNGRVVFPHRRVIAIVANWADCGITAVIRCVAANRGKKPVRGFFKEGSENG